MSTAFTNCRLQAAGVITIDFEHILHIVLVVPLLTLNKYMAAGLKQLKKTMIISARSINLHKY